ncbi:MAG: hypothetical protein COU35_01105 [Candidatus Magasanikbacteria bacterium CG10_big_fil_rev_8_21_14_0_10_47_10]|uniref:Uncharacterized protein n=1 Tax=Candidatus Magasanikbacteria bacterium CG10_big_fil_rev_8_21_14_0_10_47_10 TaxID=1974652 RepID=A0A2H0TRF1_9BACT|nr:MAG: hypothetical protein COU35_01105 [Candidatus Magasanikbacteria bacterium CG10_big_fil_rev_8_21_14_0_10_47_10]
MDEIQQDRKIDSLFGFAMELLGYKRRSQGTLYFKFEDEILDERRRRLEDDALSARHLTRIDYSL